MPKSSITYAQVAEACQALLGEGQKITLRAIVARSGGSPNAVLQLWKAVAKRTRRYYLGRSRRGTVAVSEASNPR